MSDDRDEYRAKEIEGARPSGTGDFGDIFKIQIRSDRGESKWLRIPADRFDAVKAAATGAGV